MTALACVRCVGVSLKVASQLLHATSGPVKSMEGGLHQRRHDAAHVHLVSTAVALAIVLHPESAHNQTEWVSRRGVRDRAGSIKARVSSVALLLSWVAVDVLTLLGVAHLELLHGAHTGAPSVGWSGISIKHKTMQYNVLIS